MNRPIRRIPQQDWNSGDCGLACVAMVSASTYEAAHRAFRALPGKEAVRRYHTTHADLEAMLAALGCTTIRVPFRSWRQISGNAIVKVNARKDGKWHWVVFDGGRSYAAAHDPKPGKRHVIRDFRGLKGSGFYISVGAQHMPPDNSSKPKPLRGAA